MGQVLGTQTPFIKSTGVNARRGMGLDIKQIRGCVAFGATEKVVKPDLKKISRRGIACDMASEFSVSRIRFGHHRKRIPSHG